MRRQVSDRVLQRPTAGVGSVLAAMLLLASPCAGELTKEQLASVGVDLKSGAMLPRDVAMRLDDGRAITLGALIAGKPAALMFVDYVCTTLCGTVAGVFAHASDDASLRAGKDYAVVLIGLRTGRDATGEAAFRAHVLGGSKLARVAFLASADSEDDLARLLRASGVTAHYDSRNDQFAHPAVVFAIDPRGRVSAALDALSLTTGDLSDALAGRPSDSLSARVRSVCSGFKAALGVRSAAAMAALSAVSIAFMLALALMIFWQARISSRSGSSGERR